VQTCLSGDGANHVYATTYAGECGLPTDTVVACDDLPNRGDFTYSATCASCYQRPHQCPAKTGPDVPERGSLALLGLEIVGLAASRRKRPKAA
jgi:hypothetical protein